MEEFTQQDYTRMNAKYIYWELSNYCNLQCKQCFAKATYNESTIVDWDMLIHAIKSIVNTNSNATAIRFGGGEPMLIPYLYDLVKYCSQKKIAVDITSNGLLIDEKAIEAFSLSGLRELTISVDGLEQTHEYMRGTNTYRRLWRNIDRIVSTAKFQVSMGYTVTSVNYHEMEDFVDTAYHAGIRKFYFFRYCGDNHKSLFEMNANQLCSASKAINRLSNHYKDARFNREASSFFPFLVGGGMCGEGCNFINGILTVNYRGDVVVCAAIDKVLGNIYTDSLEELWNRIKREQAAMREMPASCSGCDYHKSCHGGCKSASYYQYRNYLNKDPLCFMR